jgi:hypothetical protein
MTSKPVEFRKNNTKTSAIHGETVAGARHQQQHRNLKTGTKATGTKNMLTVLKCLFPSTTMTF